MIGLRLEMIGAPFEVHVMRPRCAVCAIDRMWCEERADPMRDAETVDSR